MLGAIIGDTVGSIYEFHNTKDYDFPLFTNRSNYTDDTIMTMAVADWLLNCPEHDTNRLAQIFRHYGRAYRCPMGGYGHGFHLWLGDETMGPYNSWGNGAAMRASAVGWMFDTLEETEHVAELTASVTHNHPEGIKGAQATAAAIFMGRTGSSKDEIKDYISKRFDYNLDRDYETLHEIYDWDSSCQGTVPEAIIAFLNSKDFEDSIRLAVSLGGDSDTLACINGGIAEAFYKEIPDNMSRPVLSCLNADFHALLDRFKKETNYWIVPSFPEVEVEAVESKPQGILVEPKKEMSIWSQMIHLFKEQEPVFKYEQKEASKPANIKGMVFHRPSAANRRASTEDLIQFFRNAKPDDRGRMLEDILNFNTDEIERTHNFIQWIFPTRNASAVNPNAPLVTSEFEEMFLQDELAQKNYCRTCRLYLNYIGFDCEGCKGKLFRKEDSPTRFYDIPHHNLLRISRAMNSMKETGHKECAVCLYKLLIQDLQNTPGAAVNEQTLRIWKSIGE